MKLVRVYRAANAAEGHLVRGLLAAHGIDAHVFGDGLASAAGELPATVMEVEVRVEEHLHDRARALCLDYDAAGDGAAWACDGCGEQNPGQFEICWQCGAADREL